MQKKYAVHGAWNNLPQIWKRAFYFLKLSLLYKVTSFVRYFIWHHKTEYSFYIVGAMHSPYQVKSWKAS